MSLCFSDNHRFRHGPTYIGHNGVPLQDFVCQHCGLEVTISTGNPIYDGWY